MLLRTYVILAGLIASLFSAMPSHATTPITTHKSVDISGINIFYREAGDPQNPTILLLHGFPTSSHMFRNLIPLLAKEYHVLAPDYPGFGFSDAPDRAKFKYTFENLSDIISSFTDKVGVKKYAIYVFDYGAPIGFRLALRHPEKIAAIISQNGNIYEEGLSPGWAGLKAAWKDPSEANRNTLRGALTPKASKNRYYNGVADQDKSLIAPEAYALDDYLLARPGNDQLQLDLLIDYGSNVALFPKFQEYLRTAKPPVLAVWGKNDGIFVPAGAEAYLRDAPDAEIHFYDTGHFALETHLEEIAKTIQKFLNKNMKK